MRFKYVLLFSAALVLAEGLAAETNRLTAGPKPAVELPAFTPERETAALQFVERHHPELTAVLARLKTLNRDQYEQAIRQIFKETEKLALVKSSDDKLHELMLAAWKVNSRIEVLAARLACVKLKDVEREAELKMLLYRQVDLQRQIVEHNHQRLLATLKGMEANIKLLEEKRDEMVERRFGNLTKHKKAGAEPQGGSTPPKK